jgi:hypothetical protein
VTAVAVIIGAAYALAVVRYLRSDAPVRYEPPPWVRRLRHAQAQRERMM